MTRIVPLVVILAQFFACSPSRPQGDSNVGPDAAPPDLKIVVGEGGGISGLWNGYTIAASGEISSWKGKAPEANPGRIGGLDHDTLSALWGTILADKFLTEKSTRANANYVQLMTITARGSTVSFEWAADLSADSTAASIAGFRARCLGAVRASLIR